MIVRRKIPGHSGYFADNLGRIWSSRSGKMRLLKSVRNGTGYQKVHLSVNCYSGKKKMRQFYVQRLVCTAFKGEPTLKKPICIRDAPNQRPRRVVKNRYIKWGTRKQVKRRAWESLDAVSVGHIRRLYKHYNVTQCELSRRYGVSQPAIHYIVTNKNHVV